MRLVGRRGYSKKAANGWLALIQTETRARHEQAPNRPGSHGSGGGLPVSDQYQTRTVSSVFRVRYPGAVSAVVYVVYGRTAHCAVLCHMPVPSVTPTCTACRA